MPRLSLGGHVCAPGTGSLVVSVEGQAIESDGADACWLNQDECAYVHHASAQLVAYHRVTGAKRTLGPGGANWFRARDDGWAAWLNGTIRTSAGWSQAGGYLAEVAQGRVLIADGSLRSLTAYSLAGEVLGPRLLTGALGQDATSGLNVRYRSGMLLYQDTFGWHLLLLTSGGLETLTIAPRTEACSYAVPVLVGGRPWLLERSGRLTLRPYDSTYGYEVTTELCYGPDVVALADGRVKVAWSVSQGEPPADVHTRIETFETPPIDLNAAVHADLPHSDAPIHIDAPHTDHADSPHTDHADSPHTDHADHPHTDVPTHVDVPVESDMKHSLVTFDEKEPYDFAFELVEQPHQDGAPNVALQDLETGRWLTVDDSAELTLSWREASETPGAWQRFIPVPGGYVAKRDHGNRVVYKAGPWEEQ